MCELLIRVRDKVNADDPRLDAKCLKRGDVVVVVADGWPWSAEEQRNPDWRILKLPNVTVAVAQAFLAGEVETDPANPSPLLRRRGWSFDLAAAVLPAALRAWIADDTRAQPAWTSNLTGVQILALRRVKARLSNPNVIR